MDSIDNVDNVDNKFLRSEDMNEEDLIAWDLQIIIKACKALRKPMVAKGLSYKIDVIEKMVDDITRRLS